MAAKGKNENLQDFDTHKDEVRVWSSFPPDRVCVYIQISNCPLTRPVKNYKFINKVKSKKKVISR